MTHYRSPQGELLEVTGGGSAALVALGWEKVSDKEAVKEVETEQPAEAEVETEQPKRQTRRRATDK